MPLTCLPCPSWTAILTTRLYWMFSKPMLVMHDSSTCTWMFVLRLMVEQFEDSVIKVQRQM